MAANEFRNIERPTDPFHQKNSLPLLGVYLLKVNNRNTRTRCEICSKFTIVNFEHISHLVLVFLLLTLNM